MEVSRSEWNPEPRLALRLGFLPSLGEGRPPGVTSQCPESKDALVWLLNECSGVYAHVCVCVSVRGGPALSAWDEGIIKI